MKMLNVIILLQNSFKSSTEDAIFKMKQIGNTVNVDQETLSRQVSQSYLIMLLNYSFFFFLGVYFIL